MKTIVQIIFIIIFTLTGCQNSKNQKAVNTSEKSVETRVNDEILAIDILLDPDTTLLNYSTVYNKRLKQNYPEGFELDESHRPHITVIQAFVKKSNLINIENDLRQLIKESSLSDLELTANGLYYIPFEDKGLAGITVEKQNLMLFHNKIIDFMKPYSEQSGKGSAFVPSPDGKPIMDATVNYVNSFVSNSSGKKFNPHVTIGAGYKDFVDELLSEPFEKFTFKINSVSIYQLGELGTAQKKLSTLEL